MNTVYQNRFVNNCHSEIVFLLLFTETASSETDSIVAALANSIETAPVTDLDSSSESDLPVPEYEKLKKDCAMYKSRVKALEMDLMRSVCTF